MNKIAEDIIFLKDNLDKGDPRSLESIRKRNLEKEQSAKNYWGGVPYIAALIVAAISFFPVRNFADEALRLLDGTKLALAFVGIVYVCNYRNPIRYILSSLLSVWALGIYDAYLWFYDPIAPKIAVIAVIAIVIALIGNTVKRKKRKTQKKQVQAREEKEDKLTQKLHQMMEIEYHLHIAHLNDAIGEDGCFMKAKSPEYYADGMSAVWNIERRRRNDRIAFVKAFDRELQYPAAQIPEEKEVNREKLYGDFLVSSVFDESVCKAEQEAGIHLRQLLLSREETLYVNNDKREAYLKILRSLLDNMPQLKFNVNAVAALGEKIFVGEYMYEEKYWLEFPNLRAAALPVLQSPAFKTVERLNQIYEERLKGFNADLKSTLIGADGEREVAETLNDFAKLAGADKMRVLANVRMELDGMSLESDFIVICQHGVFALEVKNLGSTGSYNITVEKDGLWKKVMKNGRWKQMPDSISRQNERHLIGIERVINSKLNNSSEHWISAKSLIVFANAVVGIRNYSDNVIIRDSEIMTEIRKHPICLNEQQIAEIAEILQAESLSAKKYKIENWMTKLVPIHLELAQRTQELYPYLQDYIDIMTAINYKMNLGVSLPDYQVAAESISLADAEKEYQKSAEEITMEQKAEEERRQEAIRRDHEAAQRIEESRRAQAAYDDEMSPEERYFSFDAYMKGETHNIYYQDSNNNTKK